VYTYCNVCSIAAFLTYILSCNIYCTEANRYLQHQQQDIIDEDRIKNWISRNLNKKQTKNET
jgi:hypothetical protein